MKDSRSHQREEECVGVEVEGQGIHRVSFRSEIKILYKKLESEVIRKNVKQSRILQMEEKETFKPLYLNIKD